jgi:hypothetical protein
LYTLFFFLLSSLLITGCSYKNTGYNTGPDLMIEDINVIATYDDGVDGYGMPLRSEYKTLDITVTIRNIGAKQFSSALYIASTSTEDDFRLNNFNSYRLVEPSPTTILPDKTIEVRYNKRVDRNSSGVKFQVNYHSEQKKVAPETDYFNNTYQVKL